MHFEADDGRIIHCDKLAAYGQGRGMERKPPFGTSPLLKSEIHINVFRHLQQQRFAEMRPQELRRNGQSIFGLAYGDGQCRNSRQIRRSGEYVG